jgi:hypothetical protein
MILTLLGWTFFSVLVYGALGVIHTLPGTETITEIVYLSMSGVTAALAVYFVVEIWIMTR